MGRWTVGKWWLAASLAAMACVTRCSQAQAAQPVSQLDLSRFTGTWYEIARIPNRAQKRCVGDALALYGLEDKPNHFSVVNTCVLKDSTTLVRDDGGKRPKGASDGRLQTSYFVFLHHRIWVLALDPNYQWAMVGSPNHKTLWLLSRGMTMTADTLADLRGRAAAQGFDVSELQMTPQTDHMQHHEVTRSGAVVSTGVAP